MSTRSNIIFETVPGGLWSRQYVHHDGYLDHMGPLLAQYYNTYPEQQELRHLGDASSLLPVILSF